MSTSIEYVPGSSGSGVAATAPTEIDRAFAEYCLPFAAARSGVVIDLMSDWYYRNGAPGDDAAGFLLADRLGRRRFSPGAGPHPAVRNDTVTGKPFLAFGAGGAGGNVLNSFSNGAITPASIIRDSVEFNRLPVLGPGTGASIAWALRIPTVSTTENGIAWGDTTGGMVFGGASAADAGLVAGLVTTYNEGKVGFSSGLSGGATVFHSDPGHMGDGWVKGVVTFVSGSNSFSLWENTFSSTPTVASGGPDLPSAAASRLPVIGAYGASNTQNRFIGMLGRLAVLPSPILNDATAREIAFEWLSEGVD